MAIVWMKGVSVIDKWEGADGGRERDKTGSTGAFVFRLPISVSFIPCVSRPALSPSDPPIG